MINIKTKPVKMSLDAIQGEISQEEMKRIMAGSACYGSVGWVDPYTLSQEVQTYGRLFGISTSALGGLASMEAAVNNYIFNGPTNSTTSTSTWTINSSGNYTTSDKTDIARFMEMMRDPNSIGSHSPEDVFSFIRGEMAFVSQNIKLPSVFKELGIYDTQGIIGAQDFTQLQQVVVTNGYKKVTSGFNSFGSGGYYDSNPFDVNRSDYYNPNTGKFLMLYGGGSSIFTAPVPLITSHGSAVKPTPYEAAVMSKVVYGGSNAGTPVGNWSISHAADGLGLNFNPISGLKSQLFEKTLSDGSKEYCYVTAGTEATDPRDYAANVLQLIGGSKQYTDSINNAKALATLFGGALSFAGHSLGGGLAEANAKITGDSAITFNAAGLSPITTVFSTSPNNTDAYVMTNDPLNEIQQFSGYLTGIPLPSAGGTVHYLDNGGPFIDLSAHSIDAVIATLPH